VAVTNTAICSRVTGSAGQWIVVVVEEIGRSSVRLRYEASVEGQAVFLARNTMVMVEMKTWQPRPVPDWLRARLESALER
jgi:acyl-CoA thioesterase FadM